MRQNPSDADSEMYELKIVTFEHGQPEEFLQLMKNFKRAIDGKGATTATWKINILRGEVLQEFDELASQNTGSKNSHLKFIQEVLLGYYFSINALSKKKRVMCCAIRKPRDIPFKRFPARLTELKK